MEGASVITSADFQSVISAVTSQISVGTIVEVLAVVVGAAIGMVFMWWGVRKGGSVLMKALRGRFGI